MNFFKKIFLPNYKLYTEIQLREKNYLTLDTFFSINIKNILKNQLKGSILEIQKVNYSNKIPRITTNISFRYLKHKITAAYQNLKNIDINI